MIVLAVIALLAVAAAVAGRFERPNTAAPDLLRRHGPRLPSPRERHAVVGSALRSAWVPGLDAQPHS